MRSRFGAAQLVAAPLKEKAGAPVPSFQAEVIAAPEGAPEPESTAEPAEALELVTLAEPEALEPEAAEAEPALTDPEPAEALAEPLAAPEPASLELLAVDAPGPELRTWSLSLAIGELIAAVTAAGKFVFPGNENPLLTSILLRSGGGGFEVTGHDGSCGLRVHGDCEGYEAGEACVPYGLLLASLKQLQGGSSKAAKSKLVTLRFDLPLVKGGKPSLRVACGTATNILACELAENFPAMPEDFTGQRVCLCGSDWLMRVLELIKHSAVLESATGGVHYTNGVLLELTPAGAPNGQVNAAWVTTDGHRLTCVKGGTYTHEIEDIWRGRDYEKTLAAILDKQGYHRGHAWCRLNKYLAACEKNGQAVDEDKVAGMRREIANHKSDDWAREQARKRVGEDMRRQFLLPARAAVILGGLLPDSDEGVDIRLLPNNQLCLQWGRSMMLVSLLDVLFPSWERVVPKESVSRLHMCREDLMRIMQAALITQNKKYNPQCTMRYADGRLFVKAGRDGVIFEDSIPAELAGTEFEVCLNPSYVLSGIKNMSGDQVTIHWLSENQPVMLTFPRWPSYCQIVMPIRNDDKSF